MATEAEKPKWKRWQQRLRQTECIGIYIDGVLVAVQEIRQRKVMIVEFTPKVEFRSLTETPPGA